MLIDKNLISIDGKSVGAEISGEAVGLTSFFSPGHEEPIPLCVKMIEDAAGGTSLTVKLQQADSEKGSYEDVPGASITHDLAELKAGVALGWRFLPATVKKPWLKVVVTPQGSFTAGKIFAALVREDPQPYAARMHIDGGKVQG